MHILDTLCWLNLQALLSMVVAARLAPIFHRKPTGDALACCAFPTPIATLWGCSRHNLVGPRPIDRTRFFTGAEVV